MPAPGRDADSVARETYPTTLEAARCPPCPGADGSPNVMVRGDSTCGSVLGSSHIGGERRDLAADTLDEPIPREPLSRRLRVERHLLPLARRGNQVLRPGDQLVELAEPIAGHAVLDDLGLASGVDDHGNGACRHGLDCGDAEVLEAIRVTLCILVEAGRVPEDRGLGIEVAQLAPRGVGMELDREATRCGPDLIEVAVMLRGATADKVVGPPLAGAALHEASERADHLELLLVVAGPRHEEASHREDHRALPPPGRGGPPVSGGLGGGGAGRGGKRRPPTRRGASPPSPPDARRASAAWVRS